MNISAVSKSQRLQKPFNRIQNAKDRSISNKGWLSQFGCFIENFTYYSPKIIISYLISLLAWVFLVWYFCNLIKQIILFEFWCNVESLAILNLHISFIYIVLTQFWMDRPLQVLARKLWKAIPSVVNLTLNGIIPFGNIENSIFRQQICIWKKKQTTPRFNPEWSSCVGQPYFWERSIIIITSKALKNYTN